MQINTDLSEWGIKLAALQFQRSLTKIIVWSCRNRVQDKQCSPYLTGFLLWDDPCPSHLFQGGDGIFLLIRRPAAKHSHILTRVYVVDLQKLESLQLSYLLQHPHTQMWCVLPSLSKERPGVANCWGIAQKQQSSDKFSVIKKCLMLNWIELDTSQTLKSLIEMENISKWMISIAGLLPKPKCDLRQANPGFS